MAGFAAVTEYSRMGLPELRRELRLLEEIWQIEEFLYLEGFRALVHEHGESVIRQLSPAYLQRVLLAAKVVREAKRRIEIIELEILLR